MTYSRDKDMTNRFRANDYRRTRLQHVCPICGERKALGPLACWQCNESHDMTPGSRAEFIIAEFERALSL